MCDACAKKDKEISVLRELVDINDQLHKNAEKRLSLLKLLTASPSSDAVQ